MSESLSLTIGGIRMRIRTTSGIRLWEEDPLYQPFFGDPDEAGAAEIEVEVDLATIPDPSALPLVFDTESSWKAYLDGDDHLVVLGPPASPTWQARLHGGTTRRVSLTCGDALVRERARPVVLVNPLRYPLDQILLTWALRGARGAVVHCAGLRLGDTGLILAGPSGAGKTTIMSCIAGRGPWEELSDDRILVLRDAGANHFRMHGTPWAGEGQIAAPFDAKLGAIAFLHHAETSRLQRIAPGRAARELVPTLSVPWFDEQGADAGLTLCQDLVTSIPTFDLFFRPDESVLPILAELFHPTPQRPG